MKSVGAVVWVCAVVATACGSSGVSSGVDANKPASEVTDDEAAKICEATVSYSESKITRDLACRSGGLVAAARAFGLGGGVVSLEDLRAACDEGVEECLEADSESGVELDCDNATALPEACDAIVGDVESCLTAQIDVSAKFLAELPTCAELTEDSFQDLVGGGLPDEPEECSSLPVACGIDRGEDDGETGDGGGMGGTGG